MRLRVSEHGCLNWDAGKPVWDAYIRHRQLALTTVALETLVDFGGGRDVNEYILSLGPNVDRDQRERVVRSLHAEAILVDDEDYQREVDHLSVPWQTWGFAARHFHFASRIQADTPVLGFREDRNRLVERFAAGDHPPPMTSRRDGTVYRPLPEGSLAGEDDDGLWSVLHRRRSDWFHEKTSITARALGELLWHAARFTHVLKTDDVGDIPFRTSPGGGGRHPTEIYFRVDSVTDMEPGVYHYDPLAHEAGRIGNFEQRDFEKVAVGQTHLYGSAAQVFLIADRERMKWKYTSPRAYRALLLDAGHLSQTFYLAATALGLGCRFVGAFCDERLEQVIGLDPCRELPVGMIMLGQPSPEGSAWRRTNSEA